jgi:protein-disulfide isomerase
LSDIPLNRATHDTSLPSLRYAFREDLQLLRFRLPACLLALALTAGCKAQPAANAPTNLDLNRRIEVMVRAKFDLPQEYNVKIGESKPSQVPGYDSLTVTLAKGTETANLDFLISTDNTKLARLQNFDLANDPVFHIDVANRPIRGNASAPVTIINFDDLECPYCARMHQTLFPATQERYKDHVRFIYKDDPLSEIHPWAMHAAVNANCLASQSGTVYWQYVDYLHEHGQEVTGEDRNLTRSNAQLDRIARDLAAVAHLDDAKLNACLAKQDETAVRASASEADKLGINGTPAVFVNGERIDGALPREQVWMVIDRALREAGVEPPPAEAPAAPAKEKQGEGGAK